MWGFQICLDTVDGDEILTSFRLLLSKEFGKNGDYIDMSASGPGTGVCRRYGILDPTTEPVKKIEFFVDDVVRGVTLLIGDKLGSFGKQDVRDKISFEFDENNPPVGIYGFSGDKYINAISFITYDLASDCQNFVAPAPVPDPTADPDPSATGGVVVVVDPVVDPNGVPAVDNSAVVTTPDTSTEGINTNENDDGSVDIPTVAWYSGCIFLGVILILIIVLVVEKIRRRYKRITEVVEFKPVDIPKHFKSIEERNLSSSRGR